jgi:hypothetical protein
MSVKLVTFNLNNESPSTDYDAFRQYIENHDHKKLSDTSYAFDSDRGVRTLYEDLKVFIDKKDSVLIVSLSKPFSGRQRSSIMDWLNEKMDF